MKELVSKLKKFVVKAYNKVKQALPAYSHKNSPKKYTQHQHVVMLMLKKRFKASYRDIIDYLSEMREIIYAIGLKDVPHYTTLQKFFKRITEPNLLSLIEVYSCRAVAIDSTGFPAYSSSYYEKIAKKSKKKRYQKMGIAVDTDKQRILNVIPAIGYKHDSKFFIPLIKTLEAKYFIADKGFDSSKNIRYAMSKGKALIDVKDNARRGIRAKLKKRYF